MSFGLLSDFKILDRTFFDLLDFVTSNILMPFCTIIVCIIGGWYAKHIIKEAFGEDNFARVLKFLLKFVLPAILTAVLILGLN